MSSKPRRDYFGPTQQADLLESLGEARNHVTRLCGAIQPFGDRYLKCTAVTAAIDALAEDLTGDPRLFHGKPHARVSQGK